MANIILPGIDQYLSDLKFSTNTTGASGSLVNGLLSLVPGGGAAASLLGAGFMESVNGFIQSGFDFTCLGAQSYKKSDLDRDTAAIQMEMQKLTTGTAKDVEAFLNRYSRDIVVIQYDIDNRLRSGCSKTLEGKRREVYQQSLDAVLSKVQTSKKMVSFSDYKGQQQMAFEYTVLDSAGTAQITGLEIPQDFKNQYGAQINEYAAVNGLNPNDVMNQAYQTYLANGGGITGTVSIGENGVDWEVTAGNKRPDYTILIIGAAAFFAWKALKK